MPQPDWEDLERRIASIERHLGIVASAPFASAAPALEPVSAPRLYRRPQARSPGLAGDPLDPYSQRQARARRYLNRAGKMMGFSP